MVNILFPIRKYITLLFLRLHLISGDREMAMVLKTINYSLLNTPTKWRSNFLIKIIPDIKMKPGFDENKLQ
jgi:hypothetical protein